MKKNKGKNGLKLLILYAIAISAVVISLNVLISKTKDEMKALEIKNQIGSVSCIDIEL